MMENLKKIVQQITLALLYATASSACAHAQPTPNPGPSEVAETDVVTPVPKTPVPLIAPKDLPNPRPSQFPDEVGSRVGIDPPGDTRTKDTLELKTPVKSKSANRDEPDAPLATEPTQSSAKKNSQSKNSKNSTSSKPKEATPTQTQADSSPTNKSSSKKIPNLLSEIETKYSAAKTLTAEFEQEDHLKEMNRDKKSNGDLKIRRPNGLRWSVKAPDPSVLVSDGSTFWYYTPPFEEGDTGQVVIRKTAQVQSKLANALLSGAFAHSGGTLVKIKESEYLFVPKVGTAGTVDKVVITIDPKEKLITRLLLEHVGGNTSKISLKNIVLGAKLDAKEFVFDIPPGTTKVEN